MAVGARRSRVHCRPHYNSEILSTVELVAFEVTAGRTAKGRRAGVVDARTQRTVYAGGVAMLDPDETNVAALVAAGLGKVAEPPAGKPAKTTARS
ncbi:MAG TPA: hypothetical protein VFM54_23335 [Micromonosporaceae bacterium]|nr:hypothetical protein [Micromonosporaceae bacterium]